MMQDTMNSMSSGLSQAGRQVLKADVPLTSMTNEAVTKARDQLNVIYSRLFEAHCKHFGPPTSLPGSNPAAGPSNDAPTTEEVIRGQLGMMGELIQSIDNVSQQLVSRI